MLKFRELNSSEKSVISANRGLTSYLSRLSSGNEPTPRSWLYEDRSPDWILSSVEAIISSSCSQYPIIAEEDLSKKSKFGPQGGLAPFNERLDVLAEYWQYSSQPKPAIFNSDKWNEAKANAVRALQFRSVNRPLAPKSVVDRVAKDKKLNTNSGWPDFTKRSKPEAKERAIQDATNGNWLSYPTILGSRSMRGKQRFIFMFPMAANIVEAQFTIPLQDHIRALKLDFFSAWEGFTQVEQAMTKIWKLGNVKLGSDHKGMDQHFTIHHAAEVFDVVKHHFQKSEWSKLWESIQFAFTCHVLTCNGILDETHALTSGSGWTNFIETLFKFIEYQMLLAEGLVEAGMALGDDGELIIKSDESFDEITKRIVQIFNQEGLESQEEKQVVSENHTHFLQRIFLTDYMSREDGGRMGGVYPLMLAIISLIFPEKFHNPKEWSGEMFAIRNLMICENTVNHPGFEEFVRFVAKGSDHMREFALASPEKVQKDWEQAKSINGFVPSYNQEKKDKPLTEFASYKILRQIYS